MTNPHATARYEIVHRPALSGSWHGDFITGRRYDDLEAALAAVEVLRLAEPEGLVGEYGVIDWSGLTVRIVGAASGALLFHRGLVDEEHVQTGVPLAFGLAGACTCGWGTIVRSSGDERAAWDVVRAHGRTHPTRYAAALPTPEPEVVR